MTLATESLQIVKLSFAFGYERNDVIYLQVFRRPAKQTFTTIALKYRFSQAWFHVMLARQELSEFSVKSLSLPASNESHFPSLVHNSRFGCARPRCPSFASGVALVP
jgi:hypothetical protein